MTDAIRCEVCSKVLDDITRKFCDSCRDSLVPTQKARDFVDWLQRVHPEMIKEESK